MPPTIPINHYGDSRNQQNRTARPILLFHANVFRRKPALNTLIFSRQKSWFPDAPSEGHAGSPRGKARPDSTAPLGGPPGQARSSTTSFLTATTLIYAIGAGITAAAGTRLALQLFLVKGFKLYSFQLQDQKKPCISIYWHYLPVSGFGNLRACCLPWMW